jgi:hypothetical protein
MDPRDQGIALAPDEGSPSRMPSILLLGGRVLSSVSPNLGECFHAANCDASDIIAPEPEMIQVEIHSRHGVQKTLRIPIP